MTADVEERRRHFGRGAAVSVVDSLPSIASPSLAAAMISDLPFPTELLVISFVFALLSLVYRVNATVFQ